MLHARLGGLPRADRRVRGLLRAIAAGSVPAVGELFDLYGADVWSVAVRLCDDQELAERATVAVFCALWEHPESVPTGFDAARHHLASQAGVVTRRLVRGAVDRDERRAR